MNTSSLCWFKYTQQFYSSAAYGLPKQSQYPTLKILARENLAEVFSPNFMCVQTHLCVALFISPSTEDVKIIFHSLLWLMSAFEFLFSPSQNSILHFHHHSPRTKPRQFDFGSEFTTLYVVRWQNHFSFGFIRRNFLRFSEPYLKYDRVFWGKSITLMNFISFFAQMLTSNNNNTDDYELFIFSQYIFFFLFHFNLLLLHNCLFDFF